MFKKRFMPFFDADGGAGAGNAGEQGAGDKGAGANQQAGQQGFSFDYERLASIVQGRQTASEDSVLRGYFKQQGLSKEEAEKAMADFKTEKAKNTPDVAALQSQAAAAQQQALTANIEKEALLMSAEIGVDLKTMPYLLKMADLNDVVVDGKIDNEKIKEALTKVIEDVPALKNSTSKSDGAGFRQVGADMNNQNASGNEDEALKKAFGL